MLADIYCEATGNTRASVARVIHGRGGQIDDLATGRRDLMTRSAEDALQWFSDNWPVDRAWPADIHRPPAFKSPTQDADRVSPAAPEEADLLMTSGAAISSVLTAEGLQPNGCENRRTEGRDGQSPLQPSAETREAAE